MFFKLWSAAVSEEKAFQKLYQDTERMKNSAVLLCAKIVILVDLRQKVGELVLSIISCPTIINLENTLN
jgi:hypothetical protein